MFYLTVFKIFHLQFPKKHFINITIMPFGWQNARSIKVYDDKFNNLVTFLTMGLVDIYYCRLQQFMFKVDLGEKSIFYLCGQIYELTTESPKVDIVLCSRKEVFHV